MCMLGKRVLGNQPQVRILSPPPNETSARESEDGRRAAGSGMGKKYKSNMITSTFIIAIIAYVIDITL